MTVANDISAQYLVQPAFNALPYHRRAPSLE